ncbi:MAG: hypothetical protein JWO08_1386, partial [Verrucomicrobiaceae bacterium]|nr:hypothetical protein [Verrucomicrobiaceae bacterium]
AVNLVAVINVGDWKTVDAAAPPSGTFPGLMVFPGSVLKNEPQPAVGAYRRTTTDDLPNVIKHIFGLGSDPQTPHEVWFYYVQDGDHAKYAGMGVLGW